MHTVADTTFPDEAPTRPNDPGANARNVAQHVADIRKHLAYLESYAGALAKMQDEKTRRAGKRGRR